jgi:hypothetical protein
MDGGIQRGTDMVKAFCLGARAVLCGRTYAYGLAAAGEAGVARAGNPAGGCGTHSEAARVPIGGDAGSFVRGAGGEVLARALLMD